MRTSNIGLGIRNPELLLEFVEDTTYRLKQLVDQGEVLKAADFLCYTVSGRSFYVPYRFVKSGTHLVEVNTFGNRMLVSLSDRGISYELLIHGTHEELCTYAFRDEIKSINQNTDVPACIEVGANIGYYALQEADLLGESSQIIAFEPIPDSMSLLRKNITLNNYNSRFTTHQCAVGEKSGVVEMEIGEKSNLARVSDNRGIHEDTHETKIKSNIVSIDEHIQKKEGLSHDSINIVRMDVETYEVNVLRGMSQVLEGNQPLVLFIELHAKHLKKTGQLQEVIDLLSNKGFTVTLAARRRKKFNINELSELENIDTAVNIILSRT